MERHETIAVIGLGYVGLPLALLADAKGHRVLGIDVDEIKVQKLASGKSPFTHHVSHDDIQSANIIFSSEFAAIKKAGIIVICVPTPVDKKRMPNLAPVQGACARVAEYLRPGQLVILESTVNPGVSESVVQPTLEAISCLTGGRDFHLSHCPERINPGDSKWHVENISRVVGSLDTVGLERTLAFYRSIVTGEIRAMATIREAEAVKVVENSFRDINIAFVNELAMSFDKLGINVMNVIDGASTKPFAFMAHYPGCGVGGHCIPVDPYYLIEYARENGFDHEFLSLARRINRKMPKYTAELTATLLTRAGTDISKARVTVLGLAYKANIGDTRESPALKIVYELRKMGAKVKTYDPYVRSHKRAPVRANLAGVATLTAPNEPRHMDFLERIPKADKPLALAVEGADAVVLATDHTVFRNTDPSLFAAAGVKAIVDGRNCLDRASVESNGILYKGIGH